MSEQVSAEKRVLHSRLSNIIERHPPGVHGAGNLDIIRPICACGWVGIGRAAYNDDAEWQAGREYARHLKETT